MLIAIWYLSYDLSFTVKKQCFDEKPVDESKTEPLNIWLLANDVCRRNEVFVPTFLVTVILARWAYPIQTTEKFQKLDVLNLLIIYTASGAEIANFVSYVSELEVVLTKFSFFLIMCNILFLLFKDLFINFCRKTLIM
jgi:hypothetical protein